jgi:putative acetyltransferase
MTLTVRPYRAQDCAACWAVFHRAVQIGAQTHYTQAQRNAWSPHQPEATPQRCATLGRNTTLVACTDGALIGFMSLEPTGHLDLAFVDPDHAGRGVARALHDRLVTTAIGLGLTRLTADASHLARPFLSRQGWRVITPETIRRNGVELERFKMDLTLETPS